MSRPGSRLLAANGAGTAARCRRVGRHIRIPMLGPDHDYTCDNHANKACPKIDPNELPVDDGEHDVRVTIERPGVMSTTVGDPKPHSFIAAR